MRKLSSVILLVMLFFLLVNTGQAAIESGPLYSSRIISLDGDNWLLAPDPENVGREQQWCSEPHPTSKPAKVPWIIQDTFPGYHGVAWYWRDFTAPANPHENGRYLLRFWAVDYKTDVWINSIHVGEHEGGENPFILDVTDAIKSQASNRVAVRVLNPTYEPIDGFVLHETPHRVKEGIKNIGGILEPVELMITPALRIEDLFVRPDPKSGNIRIQVNVRNILKIVVEGHLFFTVAPAALWEL